MTEREQHSSEQYCLSLAEVLVGKITSDNGRDVDQRGVGTVDYTRIAVREQPVLGQVENQQGAHPVIGKALPHLGEEQDVETLGVAKEGPCRIPVNRLCCGHAWQTS